jgi:hypothetical protein
MAERKECRHVMPSGLHCKSPAMRGSAFCYFHARATRPARPARPLETRIEMPSLLGRKGILGAVDHVVQALAANRISPRRAGILLQGIQMASGHSFSGPIDFDSPLDSVLTQNSPPHLKDLKK